MIGGGLLGLEAARGLQNFGLEVHVVHLGGHLMQQQLDPGAGAILKTSMEALGVKVHLKKNTTAILGEDRVLGLRFADGGTLECDMVVISAGIKANWEIAAGCGLTVERGIVVDDQMRSPGRSRHLRRGRMRAASRPHVRPGRAAVGAGQSAGRPHHRQESRRPPITARRSRPS